MIKIPFIGYIKKLVPILSKKTEDSLPPTIDIIDFAGQRQYLRSQYYYNTLSEELKTPKSFYNPRTGNTTHIYEPDNPKIVTVSSGKRVLLNIDRNLPNCCKL